jgi:hypothetical protein
VFKLLSIHSSSNCTYFSKFIDDSDSGMLIILSCRDLVSGWLCTKLEMVAMNEHNKKSSTRCITWFLNCLHLGFHLLLNGNEAKDIHTCMLGAQEPTSFLNSLCISFNMSIGSRSPSGNSSIRGCIWGNPAPGDGYGENVINIGSVGLGIKYYLCPGFPVGTHYGPIE